MPVLRVHRFPRGTFGWRRRVFFTKEEEMLRRGSRLEPEMIVRMSPVPLHQEKVLVLPRCAGLEEMLGGGGFLLLQKELRVGVRRLVEQQVLLIRCMPAKQEAVLRGSGALIQQEMMLSSRGIRGEEMVGGTAGVAQQKMMRRAGGLRREQVMRGSAGSREQQCVMRSGRRGGEKVVLRCARLREQQMMLRGSGLGGEKMRVCGLRGGAKE